MNKKEIEKKYYENWRQVYRDTRLSRGDLSIMLTLRDQSFTDIWFSYVTFAERTGMQRRGVIKSMDRLEKLGYIEKIPGKYKTSTNHYVVNKDLRTPSKDYSEIDTLAEQYKLTSVLHDTRTSVPQDTRQVLTSVRQDTSASVPQDTLMYNNITYKDINEKRENEEKISPLINFPKSKALDKKKSEEQEPMNTISVHTLELTNSQRFEIMKEFYAPIDYIKTKEKDVINWSLNSGRTIKNFEAAVRNFIEQDIKKDLFKPWTREDLLFKDCFKREFTASQTGKGMDEIIQEKETWPQAKKAEYEAYFDKMIWKVAELN